MATFVILLIVFTAGMFIGLIIEGSKTPAVNVKETGKCSHEWGNWRPFGTGSSFQRHECLNCGLVEDKQIPILH